MKRFFAYLVCFVCLLLTVHAFAEIRSLIKEYDYQASELDSKTSCRAIALEQVKRELLEELGTYVESTTVIQDLQIEKDEILTLTAGIVQTKVLDEKWDGRDYWLKAEVSADPDEVAASIEKLRNDQKLAEELAESQAEKEDALAEVKRLKAELAKTNADKESLEKYNQAVNQLQASDSFEQGTAQTVAGNYEDAAKSYDRAIELHPDDAKAYFHRSVVYIYLGNYQRATNDLDRAMLIRPTYTNIYYQRAAAYKDIREHRIVNQPGRPAPFTPRRYKSMVSKDDPLQRFLDKKQAEHKFVRVNPFQPKSIPATRLDGPRSPIAPNVDNQQKDFRRRNLTPEQRRTLQQQAQDDQKRLHFQQQQRQQLQRKDRPVVREPLRPQMQKQVKTPATQIERRQPIAKRRVGPVQKKTPLEEEKRNIRKQNDNQDDARSLRR